MSEKKAQHLLEQLEEEGLENVHRTLAIHHQVLMELTGGRSELEIPKRHKQATPKRSTPEGVPSPPSAGEPVPGGKNLVVAMDSRLEQPSEPAKESSETDSVKRENIVWGERTGPGATAPEKPVKVKRVKTASGKSKKTAG